MIEVKDSGVTWLRFKLVTGTSAKVQSTNAKEKIFMLKKVPLLSIPVLLRGLNLIRQLPSILKASIPMLLRGVNLLRQLPSILNASTPMLLQAPTCLGA